MNETKPNPKHRAHIASLIAGRLRLKFHPRSRDKAILLGIQNDLLAHQGIDDVKVNSSNGSVTMQFDKNRYSAVGIMKLLEDIDVLVESAGHLPSVEPVEGDKSSSSFVNAVEDFNQRIKSVTGIPIDLKLVIPASFLSAGLWSVARRGLMIETLPGWLFLWFAFDIFVKLHPVNPHKTDINETIWD